MVGGWEESSSSTAEILHFESPSLLTSPSPTNTPPSTSLTSSSASTRRGFVNPFKRFSPLSGTDKDKQPTVAIAHWSKSLAKLPVTLNDGSPAQVWGHTITKLEENKIMLAGGRALSRRPYRRETSRRVLEGTILGHDSDIHWSELKPLSKGRFGHISFKLKNFVYVAGGAEFGETRILSCEKYNLCTRTWSLSYHCLPYHLYKASVVVDEEESFALIIGGLRRTAIASDEIIIFTEKNGFEIFNQFSLKQSRYGHIALRMDNA